MPRQAERLSSNRVILVTESLLKDNMQNGLVDPEIAVLIF
jgi:hypothetical protein